MVRCAAALPVRRVEAALRARRALLGLARWWAVTGTASAAVAAGSSRASAAARRIAIAATSRPPLVLWRCSAMAMSVVSWRSAFEAILRFLLLKGSAPGADNLFA